MSAHYFGNELKTTKRYQLGELLGRITRHLLLMTATPHAGKEEDFQLFLALLDGDRFEGRYRDGVHTVEPGDLMRRMVKEELLTLDGKPLFPERRAYTVPYELSHGEQELYEAVTQYVREEMNRADRSRPKARAVAATRSASRSPFCSAGLPPARRRSFGASNVARLASRSAAGDAQTRAAETTTAERLNELLGRTDADDELDDDLDDLPARSARSSRRTSSTRRRRPAPSPSSTPRSPSSLTSRSSRAECGTRAPTRSGPSCADLLSTTPDMSRRGRQPAQDHHLHRAPRHLELPASTRSAH